MKIIGLEEHFYTREYLTYLRSRKDPPKREVIEKAGVKYEISWSSPTHYSLVPPDNANLQTNLGEDRLNDMDRCGVDMQVLSLMSPGVEAFDASDGTVMAKSVNDELSSVIKRFPKRFAGFATIAPQNPNTAAVELERAVKKLGLVGAMITGNIHGEYLDNQKYWVIFEVAEKLDVPIYIHPRQPPLDMIKPYLGYPGLDGALWGFAAEAGLHAMRLICSGVFDKYPGLKIILGHLGESIPFWLWRMDSRWPKGAMARNIVIKLQKLPSHYVKNNFYVTNSGMYWQSVLQFVCSAMGADRVMFATDYKAEDTKGAVEFIKTVQISDGDREKICHLNAEKLLGL